MTDKEKIIKEAWGNKYNTIKEHLDDNGFLDWGFRGSYGDKDPCSLGEMYELCGGEANTYRKYPSIQRTLFAPKQLQGIENNNGWIKGTPTKNGNYKLYGEEVGEEIWTVNVDCETEVECIVKCYTHYQEILDSKKPIY